MGGAHASGPLNACSGFDFPQSNMPASCGGARVWCPRQRRSCLDVASLPRLLAFSLSLLRILLRPSCLPQSLSPSQPTRTLQTLPPRCFLHGPRRSSSPSGGGMIDVVSFTLTSRSTEPTHAGPGTPDAYSSLQNRLRADDGTSSELRKPHRTSAGTPSCAEDAVHGWMSTSLADTRLLRPSPPPDPPQHTHAVETRSLALSGSLSDHTACGGSWLVQRGIPRP
ncbi:hypothetical protein B0H12DRAFT_476639 [Mycena haematopus]|nr:hypothetical protein B0H12DRAFT_476639 [Mycena haematopus]